jgi:hypothetical protein
MLVLRDELGDIAHGVIQIPEHTHAGHAGSDTGGCSPFFDKLDAETAFFDVAFLLDDTDVIRARRNTILTANTVFFVDQDDAVFPLVGCAGRTDRYAGRVVAMLALYRLKLPVEIGELPELPLYEVVVSFIFAQVVLILTRHTACIAANAFGFVNDHSVSCHSSLSKLSLPAR